MYVPFPKFSFFENPSLLFLHFTFQVSVLFLNFRQIFFLELIFSKPRRPIIITKESSKIDLSQSIPLFIMFRTCKFSFQRSIRSRKIKYNSIEICTNRMKTSRAPFMLTSKFHADLFETVLTVSTAELVLCYCLKNGLVVVTFFELDLVIFYLNLK